LVPRKDGLHKALGKQLLTQMRGTGPYEQAVAMAQQLAVQNGMVSSDLRISGSPSLAALVSLVREGLGVAIMHGMLVAPQLESGELVELELPTPPSFRITTWYPKSPSPGVTDTAQVLRRACKSYCKRVSPHLARYIG
ncbi:LysR substrate-binding domain-containing protein, partial [Treponema sp. R6D11]